MFSKIKINSDDYEKAHGTVDEQKVVMLV